MRYILENEKLRVEIDSFGAEIKSVISKADQREYMWCGDKKYWARTSPVLFPFVGSLKNKEYVAKGKTYPMGQHGFARDMEHELLRQSDDTIWFSLKSNEETLAKYPYAFQLRIGYQLTEQCVKVLWEVENTGNEILPFSIGAHPAFNCPMGEQESKAGYRISFGRFTEQPKNTACNTIIDSNATLLPVDVIHHHGNTRDTGLAVTENLELTLQDGMCDITEGFFDRCTYMIEGNQANCVGLIDPEGNEYVKVLFDTPLFAIWSPEEKNAPFVCIEPWYGRCDHVDFRGEISDREFTNFLEVGRTFHGEYVMMFR